MGSSYAEWSAYTHSVSRALGPRPTVASCQKGTQTEKSACSEAAFFVFLFPHKCSTFHAVSFDRRQTKFSRHRFRSTSGYLPLRGELAKRQKRQQSMRIRYELPQHSTSNCSFFTGSIAMSDQLAAGSLLGFDSSKAIRMPITGGYVPATAINAFAMCSVPAVDTQYRCLHPGILA